MANERDNENLVRDALRLHGYYHEGTLEVAEQQPRSEALKRLLRTASKSGGTGIGSPEFIITSTEDDDVVCLVECKASTRHHASPSLDRPKDFAADGVLHYASFLAREFHVVAIASSGETENNWTVSTYLWPKGEDTHRILAAPSGAKLDKIVPWSDYQSAFRFDPEVKRHRLDELLEVSRTMHEFMRDHAKLTESEKPLLVSGTLIALMNKPFRASYPTYTPDKLQEAWLGTIQSEIEEADIPQAKRKNISQPYSSIAVHPELSRPTASFPKGPLYELIRKLDHDVVPLIDIYNDYDVVGSFYGEFLKYTGGDKKALGIVLTPRHITELFCQLAQVTKQDIVVDTCAGTGGFLIAAMGRMLRQVSTEEEATDIRQNRLIGVENQPNMYALAASNMILRGDGKANLYQGSSFDPPIIKALKDHRRDETEEPGSMRPTVGLINPPYSQKGERLQELDFVETMLDTLAPGGTGVAIVPISTATGTAGKTSLLRKHRLEAVMSMPPELFHPVGVVTCTMVFTAHAPHDDYPDHKSWFGYWRDDGFIKTKHKGRIDAGGWREIQSHWVDMFVNRREIVGESVLQRVGPDDEWVAEAYMETDYASLTKSDLIEAMRDYALFDLRTRTAEGVEK